MNEILNKRYGELVDELCKDGHTIAMQLDGKGAHLWHMATGISGEIGELIQAFENKDEENCIEEIGDILFYIVGYFHGIESKPSFTRFYPGMHFAPYMSIHHLLLDASKLASDVLDATIKCVVYDQVLDSERSTNSLQKLYFVLDGCCNYMHVDIEVAIEKNMEKLTKRYGKKYTDQAALLRADKNESE